MYAQSTGHACELDNYDYIHFYINNKINTFLVLYIFNYHNRNIDLRLRMSQFECNQYQDHN